MKKIYALFFALMVCAVSFAALNPYAYALSSSLSADETTLTVNYSLNADATEVNVVILNGETAVKTFPCKGITKGAYTIEIPTTDFPKSTNLTWKVEVKGNSVTKPTQESTSYSFWGPRGLAIDTDPNSEYFGRILVSESYHAVKDLSNYVGSGKGAGIYVFNPDFTTNGNVENGGLDFTRKLTSSGFQPWRIKISDDGRIFVSSCDLNGVAVWEVSKDLKTWTPVISGTNNATDYNMYDSESNFVAGLNCSMDVIGSGENLKLLLYSTNKNGIANNQSGYRLDEYALGTATTFTGTPKNIINGGKFGVVYTDVDFIYDGEGGYWFGASRAGAAGQPNLVHINAEGVQDYYTESANYYGGAGVLVHNGMLFKGKARSTSANGNFGIYTIGKDSEGKVTLTEKWTVAATGMGRNINQFAVDFAENLYIIGNSQEKIMVYALPYDGEVSTPAASKYAFQLKGEVVGTFYNLTVNCDETKGNVAGNNGQYLEGSTATLTATANRGYKFTSWTVGEETVTENPLTITVNANTTVTANFDALAAYTITAAANDATMGTVEGAGTYYAGETVTLKAVANDGHHFVNWSNEATESTITFEAAEDATLTANFAKNIYTLTVNVNDSEKGSVDKATATYEFGTEVTLTATPAEGYELLAWSDRSTAQTLTITMDADKAVTAYFVTSYINEPEFKVEKVWEYTTDFPGTGNGYQAVGRDGVIYVQDAGNSKIKTITAEGITEYANSGVGQQIAIDNVGNLIVLNHTFYNSPTNVLIYKKGETEGKAVAFALENPARCDFFSASGDIFSAEGGYIYFYCNGKTVVNRLKITNGAVAAEDVTTDVVGNITAANDNQNHVMVDIWGNLVAHARSTALNSIDVATNISKAFTLPQFKISTVGGCSFELAGKEFWAYNFGTTNYNSEWSLYNMTDVKSIADTTFYTKDRTSTNSAANWLNVQVIDEKTAYIYQFCPKVGAAVWKVTANFVKPATPTIEVSENSVVTITSATPNAVIYYDWTIDAAVALGEETKYAEPITLDPSSPATYQIEALAILDGEKSDIATATFEIKGAGEAVNLESVDAHAVVYSTAGNLHVQTQVGTMIEVYSIQGQRLFAAEATSELTTIPLNEQIVVVRIADQVLKVNIK